ncbi:MAG: NAD-dependent DNA ligase LigA, partial [Candidatus Omnitrophota bacterium]|nr:NAD-dependent DNA ligase LigA [Candidatus Omnitrophota bacterium]
RGDGIKGDDVSSNLKTIRSIPLVFSDKVKIIPKEIEIRGEVYMTKRALEKLNKEKVKNGEELFANPRNAAAGSLKLLDPALVARRGIDIFIWGIGHYEGINFRTHTEVLEYLKECGFKVNPHYKLCKNVDEVIEYCDFWEPKRDKLDFEIDGMVLKVNSLAEREKLGSTTKSPRWAIAYKFPAERALTEVKDIIVGVGRTGAVTPVAILKPIHLSGSMVSRASLHNFDEITRLDVKIGDKVYVEKSGEIIPKILSVAKEKRTGREKPFHMPTECPACGSKLAREEEEVALRCENVGCPAQIKEALLHFASRNAMDIEGMGEAIVNQLVNEKLIKDYGDIYYLKFGEVRALERMAQKSGQNLMDAIEKSKPNELHRLIYALGIRHVGEHAAWVLANHFGAIKYMKDALIEELTGIREIGPAMAESIYDFFRNKDNMKVLKKLQDAGVSMASPKRKEVNRTLEGKTIVITGTLESFSRSEAEELVRKLGGNPSSMVSKNTDFLVAGSLPGSKMDKAKTLGVKVIDEEGFKKIIGR